ncbi:anti-sigma factor family protein [Planctomyces sp. SH-PL14]|uniref:anti-sigma factor family protein n=1 Tax=Planctomyces sp. SH-PL14 TaxID=1632864 RepID=UPI00078B79AF|nr:zf-HC2 domain-containing protein [Planctomyces sp. SH-PL14]AMV19896.1 hypothetical protein VT03_18510 [Planctomyces sp. SH-PL14]
MNCEQIQNDIALWVGNDLPPDEAESIRRHVAACPECRAQARRVKSALEVVGRSIPEPTYDTADSLWPAISQRLPQRPRKRPDAAWKRWAPSLVATVAAAGVMVAVMVIPPGPAPTPNEVIPRGMGIGGATTLDALQNQTKPDQKNGRRVPNPITTPAHQR